MKKFIIGFLGLFILMGASAQNTFDKGDIVLNLGVGFGNTLYGSGYKTTVPPISASFEYGIIDNLFDSKSSIGVGGYFGYSESKYELNGPSYSDFKYSNALFGARGSFHYAFVEKLDTYSGVSLGYNVVSSKYDGETIHGYKSEASALYLGWYAGARYYFTDAVAAMAEVGYDIAYLNIGVAIKF